MDYLRIPTDIWILVITFLPLSSRLCLVQTCRKMWRLADRCRKLHLFHADIDNMMIHQRGFMLYVRNSCERVIRAAKLTIDGSIAVNLIPCVDNMIVMRAAAKLAVDVTVRREFAWLRGWCGSNINECIFALTSAIYNNLNTANNDPLDITIYYRFCGDSTNILALCGYLWQQIEPLSNQSAN